MSKHISRIITWPTLIVGKEQQLNHDPGAATFDTDKANLEMMAPELLEVSCPVYSYASDLWALVRSIPPFIDICGI